MRTPDTGRSAASPEPTAPVDLLPVGLAMIAADGTAIWVNRALRRLLRVADDADVGGRTLTQLGWMIAGMGDDCAVAGLRADSASGASSLLRLRHQDAAELVVRASAVPGETGPDAGDPAGGYLVTITDVTAEHLANEELRAEREQFRILADHVGDVVLVHRGREIVWASPSVRAVLGRDPRELAGLTLSDLAPAEDIVELPPLPEPGEASVKHRLRLRDAGGRLRWFEATLSTRRPYGSAPVIYAVLRDIDDQVHAEQALAESERRLRMAFDASPDGWAIATADRDPDGEITAMRYVQVNDTALRQTGLTEEEIVGRTITEVMRGDAGEMIMERVGEALASGEVRGVRLPARPGWPYVHEGFVAPIDADTVLSSWRDVTELVEAERLLILAHEETSEMRATLQTALDATSDGFVVYQLQWRPDGVLGGLRVVHANAAGAQSLHLRPDEMTGMEIHEFFPEVESSGLWDRIVEAARTKTPQQHRVHVFDGEGRWQSAWDNSIAPVGEERMAITWRDVSNEEAALRQLARTRDEAMYSATHDALTALPNRVLLRQHLHEALRTCPPDQRVGLVFVDLDRFKAVNDTYGHAAGDVVLRETAARLGRMVRHGDLAARLAGDEFILVLATLAPDWSPQQFFARATAALSEPVWADGVELHPSASLGAVLADPRREGVDVDGLIKRADAAMYRAKAAKRR